MIFSLIEGGAELLDRVKPLWLEHRAYNAESWPVWRINLMSVTFDARRERLLAKCEQGLLIMMTSIENKDVAYCICSVDNRGIGEVDSIYVRSRVRRKGIGHAMMLRAIEWFASKCTNSVTVEAMCENDAALSFYERYGFRQRTVRLLRTTE